jgi:hypothetical protein
MAREPQRHNSTQSEDPTALTREALLRENANLKELIEVHLGAVKVSIERHEETIDVVIPGILSTLATHEERFAGIREKFADLSDRTKELKVDGNAALQAALQAADRAVGKTELGVKDQLASLERNGEARHKSLNDKVDLMRIDMETIRASITAASAQRKGIGDYQGTLISIFAIAVALFAVFFRHG